MSVITKFRERFSRRSFIRITASGILGSILARCQALVTVGPLPTVSFLTDNKTVSEDGGSLDIPLALSHESTVPVEVPFSVAGTAGNGVDFEISGSPAAFPVGRMEASIRVTPLRDDIASNGKTIVVTMEEPVNAEKGEIPELTLTLSATPPPPTPNPRCDAGTYVRPATPRTGPTLYCDASAGSGGDGTEGNPYSLARLLANVSAGCMVYMRGDFGADSYVYFNDVHGSAAEWIVFRRWPGASAQPVLRSGSSGYSPIYLRNSSYLAFEDLRLIGATSDGAASITDGSHHVHLVGCTVTCPRAGWATGITVGHSSRAAGVNDIWIDGNSVADIGDRIRNTGDGIWIQGGSSTGSANVVVVRNQIGNCGHCGITVNIGGGVVDGAIIAQNSVRNIWSTGIATTRATRVLIECNDIADCATHIESPTVANSHEAIILSGSEDGIVRFNRIWNSWGAAIVLQANAFQGVQTCVRNRIYNNTAYGNGGSFNMVCRAGLSAVTHLRDNEIDSNLYFANHQGGETQYDVGSGNRGSYYHGNYQRIWIDLAGAGESWGPNNLNGNVFRNNWFARNATNADNWCIVVGSSNLYYTKSQFESLNESADNVDSGDPLMTNAPAHDFSLRSGSGCVDRGRNTPGITFLGSAPDIGAIESH